ncbi:hypothetical protein M0805_002658 [Coniferiporia weirii]|nr:hypothetical protein M0805_002658 [Coniferiporia weirii]
MLVSTSAPQELSGGPVPLGIDLNSTLGAALIGLIVASVLFGIINMQALTYYQRSADDAPYTRWTVTCLWILNVIHMALISHVYYVYLVTNFANPAIITKLSWSFCLHVFTTAFIDLIVRSEQEESILDIVLVQVVFTFAAFVSTTGFGIKIFSLDSTRQFTTISWVIYTTLATVVVADVWAATSLCYLLASKETEFRTTKTRVSILRTYIINSGLLTSVCAICCFIMYDVMPDNFIFVSITFILPELYTNSLLATLNSRERPGDNLGKKPEEGSTGTRGRQKQPDVASRAATGMSSQKESLERGQCNV